MIVATIVWYQLAGDLGAYMEIVQVHSRKGRVKLPQGFVICWMNDDHMQRTRALKDGPRERFRRFASIG
jgi:hypothetical protein